jgi:hypothetical protein
MAYEDDIEAATLYVLASKMMGRDFARAGEHTERVMSVLSEEEVRRLGNYPEAEKEIQTLWNLGLKQNISEMAEKWRQSRKPR